MTDGRLRPVWAEVDLDALRHNTSSLARLVAPSELCAVVKADGYGHGAVAVAQAALEAGAAWLAIAMVEEALELRQAGIDASLLLLSEPPPDAMAEALAYRVRPTLYSSDGVRAAAEAAAALSRDGTAPSFPVHLKVDTGMHRVGAAPEAAVEVASAVQAARGIHLEGMWTHLAVAEDLEDPFTQVQLASFDAVRSQLSRRGVSPALLLHAANSAAAIAVEASRYDLVRCGIAVYGYAPSAGVAALLAQSGTTLRPVLSLRAHVAHVQELPKGERLSYGRRYELGADSVVATLPIGYADGVPRRLFEAGGEVLVGARRCPIAGTVTMDQVLVDCGTDAKVSVGDEAVLIGRQGVEEITAEDWAALLGTISYEVLSGIGPRVPRVSVP